MPPTRLAANDAVARRKLVLIVFLPFALGYYLSYVFRTINAVIATRLVDELALDASRIGFLTSANSGDSPRRHPVDVTHLRDAPRPTRFSIRRDLITKGSFHADAERDFSATIARQPRVG